MGRRPPIFEGSPGEALEPNRPRGGRLRGGLQAPASWRTGMPSGIGCREGRVRTRDSRPSIPFVRLKADTGAVTSPPYPLTRRDTTSASRAREDGPRASGTSVRRDDQGPGVSVAVGTRGGRRPTGSRGRSRRPRIRSIRIQVQTAGG